MSWKKVVWCGVIGCMLTGLLVASSVGQDRDGTRKREDAPRDRQASDSDQKRSPKREKAKRGKGRKAGHKSMRGQRGTQHGSHRGGRGKWDRGPGRSRSPQMRRGGNPMADNWGPRPGRYHQTRRGRVQGGNRDAWARNMYQGRGRGRSGDWAQLAWQGPNWNRQFYSRGPQRGPRYEGRPMKGGDAQFRPGQGPLPKGRPEWAQRGGDRGRSDRDFDRRGPEMRNRDGAPARPGMRGPRPERDERVADRGESRRTPDANSRRGFGPPPWALGWNQRLPQTANRERGPRGQFNRGRDGLDRGGENARREFNRPPRGPGRGRPGMNQGPPPRRNEGGPGDRRERGSDRERENARFDFDSDKNVAS